MHIERFSVAADGESLDAMRIGSATAARRLGHLLIMHGAGQATKERTLAVAETAAAAGFEVVSFDFSGHGASSGRGRELSLERRARQATAVIESVISPEAPLSLLGLSMSGQTVGDLLGRYATKVRSIGLLSPAVYPRAAWSLPFDDRFSTLIRVEGAWADSAALEAFKGFTGRSLLVTPQLDSVIPEAVTEAIVGALSRRSRLVHMALAGASHQLGSWLADHEAHRQDVVRALAVG